MTVYVVYTEYVYIVFNVYLTFINCDMKPEKSLAVHMTQLSFFKLARLPINIFEYICLYMLLSIFSLLQ